MFEKENKPFIVAASDPDTTTTVSLILQYGGHKVITAKALPSHIVSGNTEII